MTTIATAVVIVTSRLQNETTETNLSHNCAFCVFPFFHLYDKMYVYPFFFLRLYGTVTLLYVTLLYCTMF